MGEIARLELPPHSIEAEQALLGGIMIDPAAWPKIANKVDVGDFYRNDHRIIFAAITTLGKRGAAIDPITVIDFLESQGTAGDVGGLAYVGRLARDTPSAANIETYGTAVRERATLRRLKAIAEGIAKSTNDVGEHTALELVAKAQEQLSQVQNLARTGNGLIESRWLVRELTDDLQKRLDGFTGLQLGLADFDVLTCGLEPGDLIVFAARPGMGKTALLVSIASIVSQRVGVAIFSAEMPSSQLMRRCLAHDASIPQGSLRRPEKLTDLDWGTVSASADRIASRKLWIDDSGQPTLAHIRSETLALKSRASLGLVLVDYVQLVRAPGNNRYEALRDVAYGLKALAKELEVPIIVLAQLNRGVESREYKRPQISDLRDSGAIEEAADIVGLLYSEGYYDPNFLMPYVLECAIAKNRNGERGNCLWNFAGAHSRVTVLNSGAAAEYRKLISKPQKREADL